MSRKAREDKSAWRVPSIYAFAGDYGPFKPRPSAPVEDAVVFLTCTLPRRNSGETIQRYIERHPMYGIAAQAQKILLEERTCDDGWRKHFRHLIVIDVADVVAGQDDPEALLGDLIKKENEARELVKGFGKTLLRLLQRLDLRNVTLAAEGELSSVLLKLCDAAGGSNLASDIWLWHPVLPAEFVNAVLVPMGKRKKRRPEGNDVPVHVAFPDEAARDKRLSVVRHVFPRGETDVLARSSDGAALLSMLRGACGDSNDNLAYDAEFSNSMGKSLFMSTVVVEMNRRTKQYERVCEDVTSELLKVVDLSPDSNGDETIELKNVDWNSCERHVGALVLRGNRCVLVRSLAGHWKGMRFPSVVSRPDESAMDAAVRSVVESTEADPSEVRFLDLIPPVTVYAPNGRHVMIQLYSLYAVSPPPDGPLEEADMEDEETPYDWYTYEKCLEKLDDRSVAALRSASTMLVEAANVGILPCKWGGVFGQEMETSSAQLLVEAERWGAPSQGDALKEVRKANADILSRLSSNGKGQPRKLPCTILSGFLGSGKTTLLTHILTNYSDLKVAILVNDMGAVNIDAALLTKKSISVTQRDEHLVEMSNGCICCTLREDLLVEVAKIANQDCFDYLLIESTGVSEPLPVAETFTFEDDTGLKLGDIAHIDTLVTVVDGSRFLSELNSLQSLRERNWHADPEDQRTISHLLCDQVEFSNLIVLNKCDLMNEDEKHKVKRLIEQMNPAAKIVESTFSAVPLDLVLGTGMFSFAEAERHDNWLKEARIGEHQPETLEYGISSFTYRHRKPFHPHKLHRVLEAMINETDPPFDKSAILRAKGFVWLASFPTLQGDFSLAGHHFSLVPGNPWWADIDKEHWPADLEAAIAPLWDEEFGDRQQEIVIIGQRLDEAAITAALNECLLSDEEAKRGRDSWHEMCQEAGDPFYEDWYVAIEGMTQHAEDGHSHDHHHDHGH